MDVKEKIAKLRKERGWTLGKLAHEAGISTSAVYNWYNDKNYTPGRDAIEDVCAAFGITQSEFWADVEVDKLTDKEMKLLESFRNMSAKKQEAVINIMQELLPV